MSQLIKENEMAMFGNGAFPQKSPFYNSALDDMVIGGEPFRLSWPYGIEEPDQEVGEYILICDLHTSTWLRLTSDSTYHRCTAAYA